MDSEYDEEGVLSILRGRKGWDEKYTSINEFKEQLEEADLTHHNSKYGLVFWRENERKPNQQIITLLKNIPSIFNWSQSPRRHYLVQYWGVEKVEGQNHYLSTSNYPFSVGQLSKGHSWYRKLCRDHHYIVDVDDQEQLIGGVGRAYRKKQPESSPDLRLYSTSEFPMRDEAARCGFKSYLALPIFQSHTFPNDQCCGVLELLSDDTIVSRYLCSKLDGKLQTAGLRSSHSFTSNYYSMEHQPESEIREMLELAMKTVPRLYLAQVWVPCKQCCWGNIINTNLCCMVTASFIASQNNLFNWWNHLRDREISKYLGACEFHHLQIADLSCFDSSVGDDLSTSKNPLACYAHMARMSHSFAVSLISVYNSSHFYVIQFFHQDSYGDHCLHLLSRIMEMNLKTFKLVSGEKLLSESQKLSVIECESTDGLNVMESYEQKLSQSDFIIYLEMDDSCCLQSPKARCRGWVFSINSNSLLVPVLIKKKIEKFMKNVQFGWTRDYWIIQFWVPKMVENRCYLQASDQPFIVGCLAEGLASFRKKCMMHSYFVDDEAKEDELGPPGRVFRNRHPEFTPDLFHYSTKEFPIRNYAVRCCSRGYFSLPIFDDELNHKCVGVLEFVGFSLISLQLIGKAFEAAKLCWTHTDMYPRFLADELDVNNIIYGREEALTEVHNALELICSNIPQLYMANVWVHDGECVTSINSNTSCMELRLSRHHSEIYRSQVKRIHVHSRKGMIGMVMASENKSCFCRNLFEFSIVDQPLSHFEMSERLEVCFAIGLQSSHTGGLLYVVEFYLYQGPATYEYLRSFLNFLLPIMKRQLKSFKMASGKQLGEELVVDVIQFSDANEVDTSVTEATDVFPIKFQSVQYSKQEHQDSEAQQTEEHNAVVQHHYNEEQQAGECNVVEEDHHREEQQTEECRVAIEHQDSGEQQTKECSVVVEDHHSEEQQTKECSLVLVHHHSEGQTEECSVAAASDSKRKKRGKRKTQECSVAASNSKIVAKGKSKPRRHLTLEDLQPLFHVEKLKDVRKMLSVSKATLYRAREKYVLLDWPGKLKKNPLPGNSQQDAQASTSTSNIQPLDTNTASTHHVNNAEKEAEAEKVTIKATYGEDTIRLELCLPLEFAELITQVARKLNLDKGAFKLKYLDEDGADILLTDDADLQLCWKTQITLMHKTFIQLFVR